MSSTLWIDCECPVTRGSWDVDEIVGPDAVIPCQSCDGEHRAGDIGQLLRLIGHHTLETVTEAEWRAIAEAPGRQP